MPDLSWLPRVTLMSISIVLAVGAVRVFASRIPSSVWSRYSPAERRALRRAVSRTGPDTLEGIACMEHRARFERLRRAVLTLRRTALACIAASLVALALSMLSRYLP